MDSVQRLRKKATDAGKLESNDKMKVETKVVESKTVVEIQPTSTQVVYVPAYNPTVIWGPPPYASREGVCAPACAASQTRIPCATDARSL